MMNKPLALFLDKASLYPDDLDFSILEVVARWQWFDNVAALDVKPHLETAEIIVANKTVINATIIDSCPQLKLICVAATGVNNVDIERAKQSGIRVCNVRAYATSSVVQHVFALILSLSGNLNNCQNSVTKGRWSNSSFFCHIEKPISELEGKVLGIIGFGELGKAVAKMAECFGMQVLVSTSQQQNNQSSHSSPSKQSANADLHRTRVSMSELLAASDVVSLHCPLTENNRHFINAETLAKMKEDAILINTARGGLIDEQALLSALKNKRIGAAGLDVLEEEPPPEDYSLIHYHGDNLIITPHIAWASQSSRQRLVNELAKNIQAFQQGQSRNII